MTKNLYFVLLTISIIATQSAHATKSRLGALQFASFWVDTQSVFQYPQYASQLGEYATFELGAPGTFSTSPKAEGGFYKKTGDGFLGGYVGHDEVNINTLRAAAGSAEQQNPLYFAYAAVIMVTV